MIIIKLLNSPRMAQGLFAGNRFFKLAYKNIREHNINIALSSFMALYRLTVIAGYDAANATPEQKEIYRRVSAFLAGA